MSTRRPARSIDMDGILVEAVEAAKLVEGCLALPLPGERCRPALEEVEGPARTSVPGPESRGTHDGLGRCGFKRSFDGERVGEGGALRGTASVTPRRGHRVEAG